jgi:two-component system nitrate/nitrite response regulator NarL
MREDYEAQVVIRTPDQRLRVFVSSTLAELAAERAAASAAVSALRLTPVLFELGARPHPPRELYHAYLAQSDIFIGVYWQHYGWVGPSMEISGVEDEYRLSSSMPRLLYIKAPAPDREPRLTAIIDEIRFDGIDSYSEFATPDDLGRLVRDDLAVLISERFTKNASTSAEQVADARSPVIVTERGTTTSHVRVVVADDHPFFRDGVTRALDGHDDIEVVAEAGTGREAIDAIREHRPEIALVDYQMPDLDGIQVVHEVVHNELSTRVVVLSAYTDGPLVYSALREGAAGYLPKDAPRSEIVDGVLRVSRGETVVPPELAGGLASEIRTREDSPLSDREREVLQAFARGLSVPQVASELQTGVGKVKTHAQRIYEKLGVSDRAAAVAEGMRRGLVD